MLDDRMARLQALKELLAFPQDSNPPPVVAARPIDTARDFQLAPFKGPDDGGSKKPKTKEEEIKDAVSNPDNQVPMSDVSSGVMDEQMNSIEENKGRFPKIQGMFA